MRSGVVGEIILSKDEDFLFILNVKRKNIVIIFQQNDTLLVDLSGNCLMFWVGNYAINIISILVIKDSHGHH